MEVLRGKDRAWFVAWGHSLEELRRKGKTAFPAWGHPLELGAKRRKERLCFQLVEEAEHGLRAGL